MKGRRGSIACILAAVVISVFLATSSLVVTGAQTINFPNTTVGQSRTVQFTYTLSADSGTAAAVTISPPAAPFAIDGALSFPLNPGQSHTFNVMFSPTAAQTYEGSFTISAVGGFPPRTLSEFVTLTGTGTGGTSGPIFDLFPGVIVDPGGSDEEPPAEMAQIEAKLDGVGTVLDEFRSMLDGLGWWLGRLTHGTPIGIGPYDTNPMPQTSTWAQLAQLEAKIDLLLEQPAEITSIDLYVVILEMNTLVLNINQLIINLGGNTAALETKLDALEVKADSLKAWLEFQLAIPSDPFDDFGTWLDDTLAALEAKADTNAAAIRDLKESNDRIEVLLRELLRYPAPPDASKITLTMGGGPLPSVPWEATVAGTAGAVAPDAVVTIYWPVGLPPNTVIADAGGAFSFTIATGNVTYSAVDVTQTDSEGRESARAKIPVSP